MSKKIKIAICYDFDGTLSPTYMQSVSFIPKLGMRDSEFWSEVKTFAKKNNIDEILSYMHIMLEKAKSKKVPMNKNDLHEYGRDINFFPGVESWFERINQYGKTKNITIEHYIISSGMKEMIEGTTIAHNFKYIYACSYAYDEQGNALCAGTAVNYTNKTQHLFRINKGIFNFYENEEVNRHTPKDKKYIDFSNMIYIGDGETDVPCMKMVMLQGGHAIAVYNPDKETKKDGITPSSKMIAFQLFAQNRANYIAPANYEAEKDLDKIIKTLIDKIAIKTKEQELQEKIKITIDDEKIFIL